MSVLTDVGEDIGAFISAITPGAIIFVIIILGAIFIAGAIAGVGAVMTKIFGGKK